MEQRQRMLFVDNLRLGVIVLVVCMHVAVTYSGLGDWYYKEGLPLGTASFIFFAVFQCFLQAFFMGTLFMLAGYYAAASLASKGAGGFIKGRLIRLGAPTLFYMLVINPFTVYYLKDWDHTLYPVPFTRFYAAYIEGGRVLGGTGPMWFALALLIFCVVFAAIRQLSGTPGRTPSPRPFPSRLPVLVALAASALAFALRLEWPIGTNFLNMQLCYFSQYVILFCFGIAAHGNGWLERIEYPLAVRCLAAAGLGMAVLLGFFFLSGAMAGDQSFRGGFTWQNAAFSLWESFTGVFMTVGLVGVLRRHWNTQGAFAKSLSDSAFAVYVFHAPMLVFISLMLRGVELAALPKFLLVCAVALPVCFAAARLIRATPVLRSLVRS
ncbi:acyltransferase family protein [Fundidesulfovibrio terrae]|uniref:acyltransferase family protein n=1 Tax=Fundidesulfovibrio terrae TaxID=2922866 RepID=UPI001FAEFA6A|nr:acyltransferase family protein [Fundidesulfovibrio terrae]